jgi:hypothetical protein
MAVVLAAIAGLFGSTEVKQTASSVLTTVNYFMQNVTNTCSLSCTNSMSNTSVVVDGSSVGNINISQTCSIVGSKCTIKTILDVQITNILKSMFTQKATTDRSLLDMMGSTDVSMDIHIEETVRNSVTQLVNTTCNLSSSNTMTNTSVVFKNGATGGNINIIQDSSLSQSDCILETVAKTTLLNDLTATGDQTSTTGTISVIMSAIITIVMIIAICVTVSVVGKSALSNRSIRQIAVGT